jgi:hypothetical protein
MESAAADAHIAIYDEINSFIIKYLVRGRGGEAGRATEEEEKEREKAHLRWRVQPRTRTFFFFFAALKNAALSLPCVTHAI